MSRYRACGEGQDASPVFTGQADTGQDFQEKRFQEKLILFQYFAQTDVIWELSPPVNTLEKTKKLPATT